MILHGFASRSSKNIVLPQKALSLYKYNVFVMEKNVFLDSSMQNHSESFGNYLKKSVLEPKRTKLNQVSEHGHVRIPTFHEIPYVSDLVIIFLKSFPDDSAWFCVEELKNIVFSSKNII